MQHRIGALRGGHNFGEGRVSADFNADVLANPGFIETSCYWKRINTYRERFSDEQIFIFFLEDFRADPYRILSKCFTFLGLDPEVRIADVHQPRNASSEMIFPTRFGSLLRGVSIFDRALNISPIRRILSGLIEQRFATRPGWDFEVLRFVIDRLTEDVSAFLRYGNKPSDYWNFDDITYVESNRHRRKSLSKR
jgi:hypothetical protein